MRWPWHHRAEPSDPEGKELAKQSEIAKVIKAESIESAHHHRFLRFKNHFGADAHDAFRLGRQ